MKVNDLEVWEVLRQITHLNIKFREFDQYLAKHGLYTKGGKLETDVKMTRTKLEVWTQIFEQYTKGREPPDRATNETLL